MLSNYWDTCGSLVIKCLFFGRLFTGIPVVAQSYNASVFLSSFFFLTGIPVDTKWKNCAIVPSGHWALNTMITNCDPMRCSHADHACYLDDD